MKHFGFGLIEDKFRYLGIIFTKNMRDMNVVTFDYKVTDISNLLKGWLRRKLTVYGKRTVLKTLTLSTLPNALTVLPCPPYDGIQKLQKNVLLFFSGIAGQTKSSAVLCYIILEFHA